MRSSRFYVKNASGPNPEIYLYDEIGGDGITSPDFIGALKECTMPQMTLRINSPGGDVFHGNAIFNALKRHPAKVSVAVDGLAASMASVIAMAGDRVTMAPNAMMMIHNPSIAAGGNAGDMRKSADMLDKIKANMVDAYAAKTGLDPDKLANMMGDETWMGANETVQYGFADDVGDPSPAADICAVFNLSAFKNVPAALLGSSGKVPVAAYELQLAEMARHITKRAPGAVLRERFKAIQGDEARTKFWAEHAREMFPRKRDRKPFDEELGERLRVEFKKTPEGPAKIQFLAHHYEQMFPRGRR